MDRTFLCGPFLLRQKKNTEFFRRNKDIFPGGVLYKEESADLLNATDFLVFDFFTKL